MKKLILMSLLWVWLMPAAMAQQQVSGKVTDYSTGEDLPGVNILLKGTTTGTITDIDGNYKLEVPGSDAVLVFSFIGYEGEEITVGSQRTIDVQLMPDLTTLDEVVVTGYGTMKKSDLTGAVASVSGEKLRNTVATNVDQALQGRVAGVQVTQNSGQPGGAVSIRIRGTNSITGSNEPLYVIDGIQFQGDGASTSGFDWAGGANGQNTVSPLSTISPSDIESIDVLKDASATAIYGSRAANGVVIITTKRGKAGQSNITYDGYYAVQELPKKLDMMNLPQYAEYFNELAAEIDGINMNERFRDPSLLGSGTDWQDEVFQVAPMQSHQLSFTGGSDKSQYAIMGGYSSQDGIIIGSGIERFNVRANLDNTVKDWFKVGASLAFTNTDEKITLNDGGDGVISQALQMPPDVPVRDINGNYAGPTQLSDAVSVNPVGLALLRNNTLTRQRVTANFYGDVEIIKGLTFRSEMGFDNNHSLGKAFKPTYEWGLTVNNNAELKQREENSFYWIFKNYLTYNIQVGTAHNITAMLGTEAQKSTYEGSEVFKANMATNDIISVGQGDNSEQPTNGWIGSSSLASYYTRLNYSLLNRYLFTFTLRADGSSKFGPNNRWGYFPSAAVAWKVMEEDFMPSSNVLTDFKIRAGYGEVGNQAIPDYAYGSALGSVNTYFGKGYINARYANPDLKWETTIQYNLGIDLALWNGRVDLSIDGYKKYTEDMLLQVNIPNYLGGGAGGVGAPYSNVGKLENKGFEVALTTRNIEGNKLSWTTDFNFTLNRNIIKELDKTYSKGLYWYAGFDDVTRTAEGHPVGQFYGYITEGIFKSEDDILNHAVQVKQDGSESSEKPHGINYIHKRDGVWIGDVKFKDISGPDGKPDGIIDSHDKTYIGDPNPDFTFGFNNAFTYGPFELTVYLTGSYGAEIFSYSKYRNENMEGTYNNQATVVADRARIVMKDPDGSTPTDTDVSNLTLENPDTDVPRYAQLNVNSNSRMSDRWIEDGSYLRIQNISFAYTFPNSLTQRARIERLRVYANVQNLYTLTNYSGYDPEIGAFNQDPLLQNVDMGRYPTPRVYTVGLSLNF